MPFPEGYAAVIFDLDGTLADSMDVWKDICRVWMVGRSLQPPEHLEETIALMTLEQSANYVIELYGLPQTQAEIMDEWTMEVRERYLRQVSLKPGARQLLQSLRDKGVPMALATSCFPVICEYFLSQQQIRPFFSHIAYTSVVGKNKTHPDVYLECSRLLQVPPGQCIVLEDILGAVQGVRKAGMGLMAVYDAASHADWKKLQQQADWAVESLEELL